MSERGVETARARHGGDAGPAVVKLPILTDDRGAIVVADAGTEMPFPAERFFVIRDVPVGAVRARHAHRRCRQLLCCIVGECTVETLSVNGSRVTRLNGPQVALDVPPWTWVECRDFSPEARLLVLCSTPYDPGDLIEDLEVFRSELTRRR